MAKIKNSIFFTFLLAAAPLAVNAQQLAATASSPSPAPSSPSSPVSGTVAAAAHKIGFSVKGMPSSAQIVVTNNGIDSVSVGLDGTYAFKTPYPTGTKYNVTVAPFSPGLTCSVTYGNGTVAKADVTSVQVSCVPGQGAVQNIGSAAGSSSSNGSVVLNNNNSGNNSGSQALSANSQQDNSQELSLPGETGVAAAAGRSAVPTLDADNGGDDLALPALSSAHEGSDSGGGINSLKARLNSALKNTKSSSVAANTSGGSNCQPAPEDLAYPCHW